MILKAQNKQHIGFLAEQKVILSAIEKGFTVLTPLFSNGRYDLVLEKNNKIYKIQVKTTSKLNSENRYSVKVTGFNNRKYSNKEITHVIVLTPTEEFYIVPIDKVSGKSIRISPTGTSKYNKFLNRWDLLE